MCLLIRHYPETAFDKWDIYDFFWHSMDGIGVMRIENGKVITAKSLPKTEKDAWRFYQRHAQGKDCALHFRQKTSGNIDVENCHPIKIIKNCWLMHNGILPASNKLKIHGRSDTWHYAKYTLKPLLSRYPSILSEQSFCDLIARDIGSGNKFIIASGRFGFIEIGMPDIWHKGAKLSNLYAWSAPVKHHLRGVYEIDNSDYWTGDCDYSPNMVDDVCESKNEKREKWNWLSKYL